MHASCYPGPRHHRKSPNLFQLRVFGLGGDENGNAGVGVFPEGEETLIGCAGFGSVALQRVSASQTKVRQCTDG
jgi:hypothetical protein